MNICACNYCDCNTCAATFAREYLRMFEDNFTLNCDFLLIFDVFKVKLSSNIINQRRKPAKTCFYAIKNNSKPFLAESENFENFRSYEGSKGSGNRKFSKSSDLVKNGL